MKGYGRWHIVSLVVIAVIGISGLIEAAPQTSESAQDLLIDAAVIVLVIAISVLLARYFKRRGPKSE